MLIKLAVIFYSFYSLPSTRYPYYQLPIWQHANEKKKQQQQKSWSQIQLWSYCGEEDQRPTTMQEETPIFITGLASRKAYMEQKKPEVDWWLLIKERCVRKHIWSWSNTVNLQFLFLFLSFFSNYFSKVVKLEGAETNLWSN